MKMYHTLQDSQDYILKCKLAGKVLFLSSHHHAFVAYHNVMLSLVNVLSFTLYSIIDVIVELLIEIVFDFV